MFIQWFGPAIIFSTERFESFNSVFRMASIFSNKQAPSRDTCCTFAEQDNIKHIVTGGYWKDPKTGKWVRAGTGVLKYMDEHPEQCHLIGLPTNMPKPIGEWYLSHLHSEILIPSIQSGATHLPTHIGRKGSCEVSSPVEWQTTKSATILHSAQHNNSLTDLFFQVNSLVAADGNKLNTNDYVIFRQDDHFHLGQVIEILSSSEHPCMTSHIALS